MTSNAAHAVPSDTLFELARVAYAGGMYALSKVRRNVALPSTYGFEDEGLKRGLEEALSEVQWDVRSETWDRRRGIGGMGITIR